MFTSIYLLPHTTHAIISVESTPTPVVLLPLLYTSPGHLHSLAHCTFSSLSFLTTYHFIHVSPVFSICVIFWRPAAADPHTTSYHTVVPFHTIYRYWLHCPVHAITQFNPYSQLPNTLHWWQLLTNSCLRSPPFTHLSAHLLRPSDIFYPFTLVSHKQIPFLFTHCTPWYLLHSIYHFLRTAAIHFYHNLPIFFATASSASSSAPYFIVSYLQTSGRQKQ